MLLGVDGVGEEPVECRVVGLRRVTDEAIERLAADTDVQPVDTRLAVRFEGEPMSCSSVVTIVAKFGQYLSGSSEKKVARSWR